MKKNILILGIGFYDYEKIIVSEIKKKYNVTYHSTVYKYGKYFRNKKLKDKVQNIYLSNILKNIRAKYFDTILIFKCENLSSTDLEKLRYNNPNSKLILYLWDSEIRIRNISSKYKFFDAIHSFDRDDCLKNESIIFTPLFYRNEIDNIKLTPTKFNLYHLGWKHSDRYELLKKIELILINNNLKYKFFLYTGFLDFINEVLRHKFHVNSFFLTIKKKSFFQHIQYLSDSEVVLDISHPNQSGLTIRTIEAIAARKKIITTNKNITSYDFYCSQNILVIDREHVKIPIDFFKKPFKEIEDEIIQNYSLSSWTKKVLNED